MTKQTGLPKKLEQNGKVYERREISTSLRTINQYLSTQESYGRKHLYIVREYGNRLAVYKEISVS